MYKNIVEQAAKKAGAGLEYKDKKSTATAEVYFFRHGNRNSAKIDTQNFLKANKIKFIDKKTSLSSENITEFEVGGKTIRIAYKPRGGGSGGGAAVTAVTESAQCYYCSLAFNVKRGPIKEADCTITNLEKAAKYVQATVKVKSAVDRLPEDWPDTLIKSANIVYNKYKSKVTGSVYFHRGSPFMEKVYRAKKEVQKMDKASGNPQAPGSFSDDKWNPGDIWMTTMSPGADPLKEFKQDWSVLNQAVLDKAGRIKSPKTFLLGISLKKLGNVATLKEYNAPSRVKEVEHPYKSYIFGRHNDFFSSIDMYMKMGTGEVQFRATASTSSWQGEIKGVTAAGGKIGGGNLNFYCERHLRRSIGGGLKGRSWKETPGNQVRLNDMYLLFKKYTPKEQHIEPSIFIKKCIDKGGSFIFSKNMCLQFLDTFMSGTSVQRNRVCTDIMRYAASNTDQSSFFIKVS